jgi:hypothetical protein
MCVIRSLLSILWSYSFWLNAAHLSRERDNIIICLQIRYVYITYKYTTEMKRKLPLWENTQEHKNDNVNKSTQNKLQNLDLWAVMYHKNNEGNKLNYNIIKKYN